MLEIQIENNNHYKILKYLHRYYLLLEKTKHKVYVDYKDKKLII